MDPFTIAALVAAAASAIGGTVATARSSRAAKDAEVLRAQSERVQAQRERTQQIRAMRRQRAEIIQAGENAGASGSSSVIGGADSVSSQAFSNIQYIGNQEALGGAMTSVNQRSINAKALGGFSQAVGQFAGVALQARDVFSPVQTGGGTSPKVDTERPKSVWDTDYRF